MKWLRSLWGMLRGSKRRDAAELSDAQKIVLGMLIVAEANPGGAADKELRGMTPPGLESPAEFVNRAEAIRQEGLAALLAEMKQMTDASALAFESQLQQANGDSPGENLRWRRNTQRLTRGRK